MHRPRGISSGTLLLLCLRVRCARFLRLAPAGGRSGLWNLACSAAMSGGERGPGGSFGGAAGCGACRPVGVTVTVTGAAASGGSRTTWAARAPGPWGPSPSASKTPAASLG